MRGNSKLLACQVTFQSQYWPRGWRNRCPSIHLSPKYSDLTNTALYYVLHLYSILHTLLRSFTFLPPSLPVAPFVESFSFPRNLTRGKRLRVICTVTEGDRPLEVEL